MGPTNLKPPATGTGIYMKRINNWLSTATSRQYWTLVAAVGAAAFCIGQLMR